MSKGNTTESDIVSYFFNATAFSWNASTILYLSLHSADPGEAGTQLTSEANYTSYARVAVNRNSGGWTVAGSVAQNTALVQFPQCTGGANTLTHIAIGTASSGAGQILYSGSLNSTMSISNTIQPQFPAGSITFTED